MQSIFTTVRLLGGSQALAWTVHGTFVAAAAIALCVMWRSKNFSFEMKAAALALASLLASPYLFLYDMVVLAVPTAFLIREGRRTEFLPHEMAGIGVACLLIFVFPVVTAPVGLAAALIIAALILRRTFLLPLRPL